MSEIVFTATNKSRDHIANLEYGRVRADRKVTIWQNPGKVAVALSDLVVGVPRGHKDKRYYQWRTVHSWGFRRNKAGNILPYQCFRPWDFKVGMHWKFQFPTYPFEYLDENVSDQDNEMIQAFRYAIFQEFGVRTIADIYPMLGKYNLSTYQTIPSSMRTAFRQDDWAEFAVKVFGKTRVTPKLIAAVQQTEPFIVAYAQQFRGLIPDNELIGIMYRNHFDEEIEGRFRPYSPNVRPYLLACPPKSVSALSKATLDIIEIERIRRFMNMFRVNISAWTSPLTPPVTCWSDIVR